MFVNNSIILRMISTFPLKLRQFSKLPYASISLVKKCSHKQPECHITFIGASSRISVINQTNILSKAMSGDSIKDLTVSYDVIVKLQDNEKVLIIDVREDSEIRETGKLPGSIHIPMNDVPKVMTDMSKEDFERKYQRKKPSQQTQIIVSCKSGNRSAVVQQELHRLGYKNTYSYSGGWIDFITRRNM